MTKLLIIGFAQPGHMGSYLAAAARRLGLDWNIIDAARADASSRLVRAANWYLGDKRPANLRRFGAEVIATCVATKPDVVLTTGHAPLARGHIERLREFGIKAINYSTDDPWNPALRANWFLSALAAYDAVFSTRVANLHQFRDSGVRSVYYLPFAYDPEVHQPWPENAPAGPRCDVIFVGGSDSDRLPLITALIDAGLKVALFGGYWDRFAKTNPFSHGIVDQNAIRAASASAQICLCLVRRANRDGNTMRSFEAAAIGGCILAEDTPDHRELFGPEDDAVRYFTTNSQMVRQAKLLIADTAARARLSLRLRQRMTGRNDTYSDRLKSMLDAVVERESCVREAIGAR
jgi:spore maturation protein CgeB